MDSNSPIMIMPPVYDITPFGALGRRWCKLSDILTIAPKMAKLGGNPDFRPSAEELISRFAELTPFNKSPDRRVKVFRYSRDGRCMGGKELMLRTRKNPGKFFEGFKLDIDPVSLIQIYVEEFWARETLEAIRRGAVVVHVQDLGHHLVGYPEDKSRLIELRGKPAFLKKKKY